MILIKDRHQKYPFPGMEPNSGKYDTYKGSTHVVVTNSVDNPDEGNMILIKDRHYHLFSPLCSLIFVGNMILIKDRHMKELSTSISVLLFWEI